MSKRFVILAAVIGLVVFVPSVPARGVAKRKHECTNTSRGALIEQDPTYPNVGSTAEGVLLIEDSCDGGKVVHGAGETHVTITAVSGGGGVRPANLSAGGQATPVVQFRIETIGYSDKGTLKFRGTGTATPQANGSISLTGETKDTGGTRLYRGVTGSGTFSGSLRPNGLTSTEGKDTRSY